MVRIAAAEHEQTAAFNSRMMFRITCESASKCQQIAAEMQGIVPKVVLFTVAVIVIAFALSIADQYRLWPWVE